MCAGTLVAVAAFAQEPTTNWPYLYPEFKEGELNVRSKTEKALFNIHLDLGALHYVEDGRIKEANGLNATTLVIGLPTNMNGTKGDRVVKTEKFAKALKEASPDIEIIFEDERLTTKYADRLMLESGKHQKQKGVSDKLAAMIILQGYLDRSKL